MVYRTENAKTQKRENEIEKGFGYTLAFNDGSDDELFGSLGTTRFCSNLKVIPIRYLPMNCKGLKPSIGLHLSLNITG